MKNLLLILFILQTCTVDIYPQEWIENDVTKFLKKKWVYDVYLQNETAWILTHKGLYKYFNGKFENYLLDSLSSGPISQYRSVKEQNNDEFSGLTGNNSILWIISNNGKVILKLTNDTLINIKPDLLGDIRFGINEYCIDEKGTLWFSYSEQDTTQKDEYFGFKDKYKLAHYNGTGFSIYPVPEHLSRKLFYSFIVHKNTFYFLCPHYENERGINNSFFYVLKNSFLDSISLGTGLGIRPQIYFKNDTVLVINDNDKVFIISDNKIVDTIKLIEIGLSFKSELTLLNDNIYVTSWKGLYIYNLQTKKYRLTKPYDYDDNCFSNFDAIRYNLPNNQLWLLYGGALITDRYDYCHFGLSVYQLK
ncbi:MAG TPA: hypothetical protein PKE39_13470 [Ignavibacteria bacterium]|nr:hypothetical protein [Ignavibacteria bacterium]HMR00029.1 hypothetical protein [Ignavibacteria bacterium]